MLRVRRFIVAMVPLVAMCATLAVSTGSASASESVTAAIRSQDQAVSASGALKKLQGINAAKPGNAKKLIKPFETLAAKFSHAATVVANSTADSASQRLARGDWSTGVRKLATGFRTLARALRDVSDGNASQAPPLIKQADKLDAAGQKLIAKADRLLGLAVGS